MGWLGQILMSLLSWNMQGLCAILLWLSSKMYHTQCTVSVLYIAEMSSGQAAPVRAHPGCLGDELLVVVLDKVEKRGDHHAICKLPSSEGRVGLAALVCWAKLNKYLCIVITCSIKVCWFFNWSPPSQLQVYRHLRLGGVSPRKRLHHSDCILPSRPPWYLSNAGTVRMHFSITLHKAR